MNSTQTRPTTIELSELGSALKHLLEGCVDTSLYSFDRTYFDMDREKFHLLYDGKKDSEYAAKEFILRLGTLKCQEINYTLKETDGTNQLKKQMDIYFTLNGPIELHEKIKALFPPDPIEEAINATLEAFASDFDINHTDEGKKCSCGGTILPMYDEHPNWIHFCNRCDSRSENDDFSPLPY